MKLMVPVTAITILLSPVSSFAESSGQDLDLGKYHLTFDWEAEDFNNSPFPGPGQKRQISTGGAEKFRKLA